MVHTRRTEGGEGVCATVNFSADLVSQLATRDSCKICPGPNEISIIHRSHVSAPSYSELLTRVEGEQRKKKTAK